VEKAKPTYDLEAFRGAAKSIETIEITLSASRGAGELGIDEAEMLRVLQSMERTDFVKSMTSYADHTVWQDVYNVPWGDYLIYVKFTAGRVTEFRLLSFKEK
jgi:motility quorum-sensing regulator/GCU-specific mRNA interferase toxin